MGCFKQDLRRVLKIVFPTLLRGFLYLFESEYFQSKGKFIKSVFQSVSCVFLHQFNPSFLTHILELSIPIPSYRRVVVRLFLGDQSVVITKDFIFALRRRTCVFVWFRVLVRAHYRGAASAS